MTEIREKWSSELKGDITRKIRVGHEHVQNRLYVYVKYYDLEKLNS